MKRNERLILGSLAVIGLIAAFWLLVLGPKRHQASELQTQVDELQSSLAEAQQDIAAGDESRKSFGLDYRRMVVMGKAVPADSEQSSLFVQLQGLADRSGVVFQSIDLADTSSAAAAAPAPSTSTSTSDTSTSTSSTDASAATDSSTTSSAATSSDPSVTASASEAAVSTLPIGAAVGPAGLPVMPYEMSFTGDFFQIADFMQGLDELVRIRGGVPDVRGRLLTVDGFTLTPAEDDTAADPELTVDLGVTTFLTPADQGVTAGATPGGPTAATPTLTSSSASTDSTSTTESSASTETTPPSTTSP